MASSSALFKSLLFRSFPITNSRPLLKIGGDEIDVSFILKSWDEVVREFSEVNKRSSKEKAILDEVARVYAIETELNNPTLTPDTMHAYGYYPGTRTLKRPFEYLLHTFIADQFNINKRNRFPTPAAVMEAITLCSLFDTNEFLSANYPYISAFYNRQYFGLTKFFGLINSKEMTSLFKGGMDPGKRSLEGDNLVITKMHIYDNLFGITVKQDIRKGLGLIIKYCQVDPQPFISPVGIEVVRLALKDFTNRTQIEELDSVNSKEKLIGILLSNIASFRSTEEKSTIENKVENKVSTVPPSPNLQSFPETISRPLLMIGGEEIGINFIVKSPGIVLVELIDISKRSSEEIAIYNEIVRVEQIAVKLNLPDALTLYPSGYYPSALGVLSLASPLEYLLHTYVADKSNEKMHNPCLNPAPILDAITLCSLFDVNGFISAKLPHISEFYEGQLSALYNREPSDLTKRMTSLFVKERDSGKSRLELEGDNLLISKMHIYDNLFGITIKQDIRKGIELIIKYCQEVDFGPHQFVCPVGKEIVLLALKAFTNRTQIKELDNVSSKEKLIKVLRSCLAGSLSTEKKSTLENKVEVENKVSTLPPPPNLQDLIKQLNLYIRPKDIPEGLIENLLEKALTTEDQSQLNQAITALKKHNRNQDVATVKALLKKLKPVSSHPELVLAVVPEALAPAQVAEPKQDEAVLSPRIVREKKPKKLRWNGQVKERPKKSGKSRALNSSPDTAAVSSTTSNSNITGELKQEYKAPAHINVSTSSSSTAGIHAAMEMRPVRSDSIVTPSPRGNILHAVEVLGNIHNTLNKLDEKSTPEGDLLNLRDGMFGALFVIASECVEMWKNEQHACIFLSKSNADNLRNWLRHGTEGYTSLSPDHCEQVKIASRIIAKHIKEKQGKNSCSSDINTQKCALLKSMLKGGERRHSLSEAQSEKEAIEAMEKNNNSSPSASALPEDILKMAVSYRVVRKSACSQVLDVRSVARVKGNAIAHPDTLATALGKNTRLSRGK